MNKQDLPWFFYQQQEMKKLVENAKSPLIELTFNWDEKDYDGGRNFGHLAFEVDDIYAVCKRLYRTR